MRLIQIPFSHNCVKVRVGFDLKGLVYEVENVSPHDRSAVERTSGQPLVPVLVDGDVVVTDSTAILLHVEARWPERPLLPAEARARAEALVLEDWSDRAFMALSRRIAYWNLTSRSGGLAPGFFPGQSGLGVRIKERIARHLVRKRFRISGARYRRDVVEARRVAGLALERLGEREWLVDDRPRLPDVALAAMAAPLAADPALAREEPVRRLLEWGNRLLPPDIVSLYRGGRSDGAC